MEDEYSLENLSSVFSDHAKFFEEECWKQMEEYKKNHPDAEQLVLNFKPGFNLPRALSVMCCEIERLKQKL